LETFERVVIPRRPLKTEMPETTYIVEREKRVEGVKREGISKRV